MHVLDQLVRDFNLLACRLSEVPGMDKEFEAQYRYRQRSRSGAIAKLDLTVGPSIAPRGQRRLDGLSEIVLRAHRIDVRRDIRVGRATEDAKARQEMLDEIARLGGDAGVIAIARDGSIAMPYNSEGMKRACGKSGSDLFVATFATE